MLKLSLAGTGHRPDKLGGYGPEVQKRLVAVAVHYLTTKLGQVELGISGMAMGWDQAWAIALTQLDIPWTAAIPFEGQECQWTIDSQRQYRRLLRRASKVVLIAKGGYHPAKMQWRNEWMVGHSNGVIALWNGTPGGTANCVKYAKKVKVPVRNLWDEFQQGVSHDHSRS